MRREIKFPVSVGFCKNCFRQRRDGSAYCGECKDEKEGKGPVYFDDQKNFPLYDKVKKVFPIGPNTVFVYGNTIFTKKDITDAGLLLHEMTHLFQQKKVGIDKWWDKYLEDNKFRLSQEAECYSVQYGVYKKQNITKAEIGLNNIAKELSGPLYGEIISFDNAKKLIINLYERK